MKTLRQQKARATIEIYQRIQKKKAAAKEKELLNELKKVMGWVDPSTRMLKEYRESWTEKLRYKKIKLPKC